MTERHKETLSSVPVTRVRMKGASKGVLLFHAFASWNFKQTTQWICILWLLELLSYPSGTDTTNFCLLIPLTLQICDTCIILYKEEQGYHWELRNGN